MPHFTQTISSDGPLIDVNINASIERLRALQDSGQPVPNAIKVKGLIDTGASTTCIDTSVVEALRLETKGDVPVITPSTGDQPINVDYYDITLLIFASMDQPPLLNTTLLVAELPIQNQGFQTIIGRDMLSQCVLIYNGATNEYTLSF